jgi:hypothetical protein
MWQFKRFRKRSLNVLKQHPEIMNELIGYGRDFRTVGSGEFLSQMFKPVCTSTPLAEFLHTRPPIEDTEWPTLDLGDL